MNLTIQILFLIILVDAVWRFIKPVKRIVDLNNKLLEENRKCRFEQARIAEEISLLRKSIQLDRGPQQETK